MDRIIRCITSNGGLMAVAADTSDTIKIAQNIHGLSGTASAALGRTLTAASMMGAMLKKDGASVTLKFNGGGPLGNIVAISDSHSNIRGYVDRPKVELPLRADGKLDVGSAVGCNGRLGVIRDLGTGEPYLGQVEIVSGEIAEDITNYYAVSEQIPTVCALGVLTEKESHQVLLAGGFIIQVLPGADEADISKLEGNISKLESMTTMLAKGIKLEAIIEKALDGFDVEKLDETPVHYGCTCSKKKYASAIITLGSEEILTLPKTDDKVETVCPYCKKKYYFTEEELLELSKSAEKASDKKV